MTFPFPTLLSWLLVAYTIEFDNEAEHRMPHRTTRHGLSSHNSAHKPWLVSLVMWSNCLRYVTEQGISPRNVETLARTRTNFAGMQRWGYIKLDADGLLRLTPGGRKAREVCQPLFGEIEQRWCDRFGNESVAKLRDGLKSIAERATVPLPDCLPILGFGLFPAKPIHKKVAKPANDDVSLPSLLSKVLLMFALEFEKDSDLSFAISANVLRLIGDPETRAADLPRLSGVSKEAIAVGLTYLQKRGYLQIGSGPARTVTLTDKGRRGRAAFHAKTAAIEAAWPERYGRADIALLRDAASLIVGEPSRNSPLFRCFEFYPDNWRSAMPKPETLPYYPMVLHRGGFPDGS